MQRVVFSLGSGRKAQKIANFRDKLRASAHLGYVDGIARRGRAAIRLGDKRGEITDARLVPALEPENRAGAAFLACPDVGSLRGLACWRSCLAIPFRFSNLRSFCASRRMVQPSIWLRDFLLVTSQYRFIR